MADARVPIRRWATESESWDRIWQWAWFSRDSWWLPYRQEAEGGAPDLIALLRRRGVRSVLDAACGLGRMTILLAERGFEVEGADASAVAAKYAPELAAEQGVTIRFLHACNADLRNKCGRKYDCVFSDGFDELPTRDVLAASARGVHAVLNDGGILVFSGIPRDWSHADIQRAIDREWEDREPFEVSAPYEKNGVRVTQVEVDERTADGILEKRIFLIEQEGALRAEIALMLNRRKWTFQDFDEILTEAGFTDVNTEKVGGALFTVAAR